MAEPRELPDWIADHIRRYQASEGEDGHIWNGVPTLLLTTRGRRSGRELLLPLIYGRDGEDYLIVASRGGNDRHPAWYLNLRDEPHVKVQVGAEQFAATAHTASDDERARLWSTMRAIWPAYDEYQEKTERKIPVVVLSRD